MNLEFNDKEMQRYFASLQKRTDPKTARRIWKKSMTKAAGPWAKEAKRLTPEQDSDDRRDDRKPLKRLVRVKTGVYKSRRGRRKSGQFWVAVGYQRPPGYHGHLVEFGFKHRDAGHVFGELPIRNALRKKFGSFTRTMFKEIERLILKG